jgi:hypothetical protein
MRYHAYLDWVDVSGLAVAAVGFGDPDAGAMLGTPFEVAAELARFLRRLRVPPRRGEAQLVLRLEVLEE